MPFPVLFVRIGMPLRWKSKSKQKSCPDGAALLVCYEKKLISKKGRTSRLAVRGL